MALDKSQDFSNPGFSFAHYLLHEGDCESKMITCGKNLTGHTQHTVGPHVVVVAPLA